MNNDIAVIFGGPSPEHDISILTGLQSSRVLNNKYNVHNIYWSKENKWYLVDDNLESQDFINNNKIFKKELTLKLDSSPGFYLKKKKLNIDTVLNACHGGPGEDGTLQSLLTLLEINFTGPSLTTSQLCMDKYSFYTFMKANNIPVLEKHLLQNSHSPTFEGPYILKPRFGGSSIGVEVVNEYDTALKLADGSKLYQQGATVEKFLEDSVDYLVALRTYPQVEFSEIEKPIRSNNFELFSYQDKYLENGGLEGSKRELPAQLPKNIEKEIINILETLVSLISFNGISRVDFLISEDKIYLNEINTIPGSHALYLWENLGHNKFQLLDDMVQESMQRDSSWTSEGSDGLALKSAKDIQSKLG